MEPVIKTDSKGNLQMPSAPSIDENDALLDRQVRDMLNSPGWKRLSAYYEVAREDLIDKILKASQTPDERSSVMTKIKAAVLKGFEEWRRIPDRLVARLDDYDRLRAEEREEKEAQAKEGVEESEEPYLGE